MSSNKAGQTLAVIVGILGGLAMVLPPIVLPFSASWFVPYIISLLVINFVAWIVIGWCSVAFYEQNKKAVKKHLDTYSRLKDPSHYTRR